MPHVLTGRRPFQVGWAVVRLVAAKVVCLAPVAGTMERLTHERMGRYRMALATDGNVELQVTAAVRVLSEDRATADSAQSSQRARLVLRERGNNAPLFSRRPMVDVTIDDKFRRPMLVSN